MFKVVRLLVQTSLFFSLATIFTACAHQQSGPEARGLLRLEVEPESATIFVDDEYMGRADGWVEQTIPLQTGVRMVEIRAKGYMNQRFDVDIRPNEEVTLRLQMEPDIEDVPIENREESL